MPLIDGFIDIPALDWCPAHDAVLWIMLKQPPVAFRHERSMGNAHITLGMQPDGKMVSGDPNYFPSWARLYEVASQGKVGLRGRPAIGLQKIVFELLGPSLRCEKWGEFEEILPAKLKAAGVFAFSNIESSRFLSDGMVYPTEEYPETAWAYGSIEVNVRQLVRWFHPVEGKALRVGTEVIIMEPEEPQAKSSAEAAVTRNIGGRPRERDWEAAINATWAAMFVGDCNEKPPELIRYMTDWFSVNDEKGHPHKSQIREKVSAMLSASERAAAKAHGA